MHSAGNYQYNKCASIHVHPSLLAKGLQSTLLLYNPFADLADYVGNYKFKSINHLSLPRLNIFYC